MEQKIMYWYGFPAWKRQQCNWRPKGWQSTEGRHSKVGACHVWICYCGTIEVCCLNWTLALWLEVIRYIHVEHLLYMNTKLFAYMYRQTRINHSNQSRTLQPAIIISQYKGVHLSFRDVSILPKNNWKNRSAKAMSKMLAK